MLPRSTKSPAYGYYKELARIYKVLSHKSLIKKKRIWSTTEQIDHDLVFETKQQQNLQQDQLKEHVAACCLSVWSLFKYIGCTVGVFECSLWCLDSDGRKPALRVAWSISKSLWCKFFKFWLSVGLSVQLVREGLDSAGICIILAHSSHILSPLRRCRCCSCF